MQKKGFYLLKGCIMRGAAGQMRVVLGEGSRFIAGSFLVCNVLSLWKASACAPLERETQGEQEEGCEHPAHVLLCLVPSHIPGTQRNPGWPLVLSIPCGEPSLLQSLPPSPAASKATHGSWQCCSAMLWLSPQEHHPFWSVHK